MMRVLLAIIVLTCLSIHYCAPVQIPEVVSIPTPYVEQVSTNPVEKAVRKATNRCIFSEGLQGCVYNDRLLAKVGKNGVKPYGGSEIIED